MRCWTTLLLPLSVSAALAAGLAGTASASDQVSPERQAELRHLVLQDCGSCHGMTMKGGLGSPLLPANLADLAEESIAQIILDGVPGKPMPPWRGLLSDREAEWIANALKTGVLK